MENGYTLPACMARMVGSASFLILENMSFGSLLRKLRIGCWIMKIVDWSKEWTWASLRTHQCPVRTLVRFSPNDKI